MGFLEQVEQKRWADFRWAEEGGEGGTEGRRTQKSKLVCKVERALEWQSEWAFCQIGHLKQNKKPKNP